jgi:hypothetical protein
MYDKRKDAIVSPDLLNQASQAPPVPDAPLCRRPRRAHPPTAGQHLRPTSPTTLTPLANRPIRAPILSTDTENEAIENLAR